MKKYLLFLLLSWPIILSGQTPVENVKKYLNKYAVQSGVPGFSVILVDGDKEVLSTSYGTQRIDNTVPMTVTTSCSIGSITKSFTALCVLQLEDRGLLSIDDTVIKYLPWFRTADKENSDTVTLKMLLSNSSGIPSIDKMIFNADNATDADEFVVRSLSAFHTTFIPGKAFEYSNEGWVVLGLIIRNLTGLSYADYLQKNVLSPLEMEQSTSDIARFEELNALKGHYVGPYAMRPAESIALSYSYAAAGSILTSTAVDMGHYISMLMNKGVYKGKRLVSEKAWSRLFTPVISYPGTPVREGGDGNYDSYCLGWMITPVGDVNMRHHSGSTGTMSAFLIMHPDKNIGAAIICNSAPSNNFKNINMMNAMTNVLRLYSGEVETDYALPRYEDPFVNNFDLTLSEKEKYTGEYVAKSASGIYVRCFLNDKDDLIIELWRQGILRESGIIDFLTPASAITRSTGMSTIVTFMFGVPGIPDRVNFIGNTFVRPKQETGKKTILGDLEKNGFSFECHKSWNLVEASSGIWNLIGTTSQVTIMKGKSDVPIDRIMEKMTTEKILVAGLEHRDTIGYYGWTEKVFITSGSQYTIFSVQAESGTWFIIVKTMPGDLTMALADDVRPILENIRFQ